MKALIPVEMIEKKILMIRGEKVMLDADLSELYGVTTKRLNEQLKRNMDRFPVDFAFQLTAEEWENLKTQKDESNRSQIATGS
ncbi:MAG: ORF6N domain-containing protein, partial [Nitrospirota bacterium]